MPNYPAKKCGICLCLSPQKSQGLCEDHLKVKLAKIDAKRGNTTQRGYGQDWREIRKVALARDKGLCQVCLLSGRVEPATEVDHILPKFFGGSNDLDNLQSICHNCHAAKTAAEKNTHLTMEIANERPDERYSVITSEEDKAAS